MKASFQFTKDEFINIFKDMNGETDKEKERIVETGNHFINTAIMCAKEAGFEYKGNGIMELDIAETMGILFMAGCILGIKSRTLEADTPIHPTKPWTT